MSKRAYWSIGVVVAILLSANLVFVWYPPTAIVDWIGVENTYVAIFLIAAIGGVNSLTSGVLYASLLAFAAGGANPYWLGVTCGIGIALGDSLMFWLFYYGTKQLPAALESKLATSKERVSGWPPLVQYGSIYGYLAFLPLPNDILMFILASLRFQYIKIAPVLLLGGVTFATLAALFGGTLQSYVLWF